MKVVLDTNIWISGLLLPESKAGRVLAAWRQAKFQIVTTESLLDEMKRVLQYPKIKKRLAWNQDKIDQYVALLKFFSTYIVATPVKRAIRDLNDLPLLDALIAGKADYLVTGDNDLLVLTGEYSIITLSDFFEML